jgi:ethanolamine ammonia-lyase small subunit
MVGAEVTVMENAGRDALDAPSDTLITMPVYVPTLGAVGVPESRPVVVSNVAHDGLPAMENVRVPPAASEALGWNK